MWNLHSNNIIVSTADECILCQLVMLTLQYWIDADTVSSEGRKSFCFISVQVPYTPFDIFSPCFYQSCGANVLIPPSLN